MTLKKTALLLTLIGLIVSGCKTEKPSSETKEYREYLQVCEMCGAEWAVTQYKGGTPFPASVEWCFYDGGFCVEGLDLMIEVAGEEGETSEKKRLWLKHCIGCKGCRCAAFDPEDWRKVTNAMRKVSKFEAMPDADLQETANRQEEAAIGLVPIAVEQSKRQDAKSAREELNRRSK